MQNFNELAEIVSTIEGLKEFNMEPGYWRTDDGNEIGVHLLIIHHAFESFNDALYLDLMELFPDNTDEYDDEEGCYVSTFIVNQ